MATIALFGAGGKIGCRITDRLKDSPHQVHYVEIGDAGLAKFGEFMEVAFQNSGATIYRMPDTGQVSVRAP